MRNAVTSAVIQDTRIRMYSYAVTTACEIRIDAGGKTVIKQSVVGTNTQDSVYFNRVFPILIRLESDGLGLEHIEFFLLSSYFSALFTLGDLGLESFGSLVFRVQCKDGTYGLGSLVELAAINCFLGVR